MLARLKKMFVRKRPVEDWERLSEYVSGGGTQQERDEIRARVAVDEEQARLLREIRTVWEALERGRGEIDVEAAWQRIDVELEGTTRIHRLPRAHAAPAAPLERRPKAGGSRDPYRATHPAMEAAPSTVRPPRARRRSSAFHVLRVVAPLAVLALVLALAGKRMGLPGFAPGKGQPPHEVFSTQQGERALVRLSDGTEVRLNTETRLVVPIPFRAEWREVHLEGEAFFDVAADSLRPFVVRAGGARVEVLGTAFNVQTRLREDAVEVVVAEGRVALGHGGRGASGEAVVLQSHQLGRVQAGEVVRRDGVDLDHYLVWMNRRLALTDAPFDEVARVLERRYNLDVTFQGSRDAVKPLDVTFEGASLQEVLDVIAATLSLRYTWEGGRVTFYPAPPEAP